MLYLPNTLGGKTIIISDPGLAHEFLHSGIHALSSGIRWIELEIPLFTLFYRRVPINIAERGKSRDIDHHNLLKSREVM